MSMTSEILIVVIV